MVVDDKRDMRPERHLLGAAVSHRRKDHKLPNVFHSYRGPLFVIAVLNDGVGDRRTYGLIGHSL
jgi:hypothetical protein